MEDAFYNSPNDKGLVTILKREANIMLASMDKDSEEYKIYHARYEDCISVIRAIEYAEPQNDDEIDFILNTINRVWNIGILSPLTLRKDEFLDYEGKDGLKHNTRYGDICIDRTGNICNLNAFNCLIRAAYVHEDKTELNINPYTLEKNARIYISKGGVITGEYFEKCIIRKEIVDKHCYTIQSIPTIPVCIIFYENDKIYAVDHREPKFKALCDFYEVPILFDDNIANSHFNIRKYKKLDKK